MRSELRKVLSAWTRGLRSEPIKILLRFFSLFSKADSLQSEEREVDHAKLLKFAMAMFRFFCFAAFGTPLVISSLSVLQA